jgi:hypothetical protein
MLKVLTLRALPVPAGILPSPVPRRRDQAFTAEVAESAEENMCVVFDPSALLCALCALCGEPCL